MRKFKITVNGAPYEVEVEELTDAASPPDPPPAAAAPVSSQAQGPAPTGTPPRPAAGGTIIAAPMPGTIRRIAVTAGDRVTRGQILYVLEAMKMENEIKSGVDGAVASVSVTAGDLVHTGQVIMELR